MFFHWSGKEEKPLFKILTLCHSILFDLTATTATHCNGAILLAVRYYFAVRYYSIYESAPYWKKKKKNYSS